MILYSKTDSKDALITAVDALADDALSIGVVVAAKAAARAMLAEVKEASASISIRVNTVPAIGASQIEIQLSERKVFT